MKNNKSIMIALSIVLITSIILATNFSSFSFSQTETKAAPIGGFNHIKKFDSNGNLITSWGIKGSGEGQFLHPHGIGLDSAGNVYVSDEEKGNIEKFDSNGKFITSWKGSAEEPFKAPWGVAVDSAGNVYVSDQRNPVAQKFDNNGNFIMKWGSEGTGEGQFVHQQIGRAS